MIGEKNAALSALVPRTRSSHDFSAGTFANFGFKSGTRIIDLLVSFSIPKFAQRPRRMLANFGIGTLAHGPAKAGSDARRLTPAARLEVASLLVGDMFVAAGRARVSMGHAAWDWLFSARRIWLTTSA